MAANSVAKLPEQLLHLILSQCRVKEVCRLAQTCRSLRAAACHDPLWRKLAEADLSCLPCFATDESRWKLIEFCETELLGRQTGPVWREVYRRRSMLPSTVVVDVVRPQGPLTKRITFVHPLTARFCWAAQGKGYTKFGAVHPVHGIFGTEGEKESGGPGKLQLCSSFTHPAEVEPHNQLEEVLKRIGGAVEVIGSSSALVADSAPEPAQESIRVAAARVREVRSEFILDEDKGKRNPVVEDHILAPKQQNLVGELRIHVTSVVHSSKLTGRYFNFDKDECLGPGALPEGEEMYLSVRVDRTGELGEVVLWGTPNSSQPTGNAHGRFTGNPIAPRPGQWQVGDVLRTVSCPNRSPLWHRIRCGKATFIERWLSDPGSVGALVNTEPPGCSSVARLPVLVGVPTTLIAATQNQREDGTELLVNWRQMVLKQLPKSPCVRFVNQAQMALWAHCLTDGICVTMGQTRTFVVVVIGGEVVVDAIRWTDLGMSRLTMVTALLAYRPLASSDEY